MFIRAIAACVFIAAILGVSEVLWRTKIFKGEIARKSIHIVAGTFIAFLPFWLDYGWIVIIALGFIAVNGINHVNHLFKSIFSVKRRSWGDLLFSFAILLCALAAPSKWIFAAAILHVSLADGFAAIVGTHLGKHHGVLYRIFRHEKSAIGSATFMVTSFLIIALTIVLSGEYTASLQVATLLVALPVVATLVEGFGIYGIDNLTLPALILFAMTTVQHL